MGRRYQSLLLVGAGTGRHDRAMPLDVDALPPLLRLRPVAAHTYEGRPEHEGSESDIRRNVVFGGQILAQMIMAAHVDRNEDRTTTRR